VKKVVVTLVIVLLAGWLALVLVSHARVPYCDIQIVKAEIGPDHQFQYAIKESGLGTIYITQWEEGPKSTSCTGGNGGTSDLLSNLPFLPPPDTGSMGGSFAVADGVANIIKQVKEGEKYRLTVGAALSLLDYTDSKNERHRLFLKALGTKAEFDQAMSFAGKSLSTDKK
jgi:hypothetical protein